MAYVNKSNYSANKSNSGSGEIKKSSTTHYAYTLSKDDNGETVREYVNSLQIFENEGKYGPYFKVRVTGPVPTADIFIQKKKAK